MKLGAQVYLSRIGNVHMEVYQFIVVAPWMGCSDRPGVALELPVSIAQGFSTRSCVLLLLYCFWARGVEKYHLLMKSGI